MGIDLLVHKSNVKQPQKLCQTKCFPFKHMLVKQSKYASAYGAELCAFLLCSCIQQVFRNHYWGAIYFVKDINDLTKRQNYLHFCHAGPFSIKKKHSQLLHPTLSRLQHLQQSLILGLCWVCNFQCRSRKIFF